MRVLPLLRRGRRVAPGEWRRGSQAVRRARMRLKARRTWTNLVYDSLDAALDQLEQGGWRSGGRLPPTFPRAAAGGAGRWPDLQQKWRAAVADQVSTALQEWQAGRPGRLGALAGRGAARRAAMADYDE